MARARSNPYGRPVPEGVTLVRVGQGEQTHIFNPTTQLHLCLSGMNAGKKGGTGIDTSNFAPQLYMSDAKFITCYRCNKLASINERRGRRVDGSP